MSDKTPEDLNALSKEQLIEIVSGFQEMLKNASTKEAFVKKTTIGQLQEKGIYGATRKLSPSSVMSYYKERYAKMVKNAIDKMLECKKNMVFRYEDFSHNSASTLYQKVFQGKLYLLDHLDPEMKYAKVDGEMTITKKPDGIRLEFINDVQEPVPIEETPHSDWKENFKNL